MQGEYGVVYPLNLAHVSSMRFDGFGRPGVLKFEKQAFQFASAGAVLVCAHSKGALGRCYVYRRGVAADEARGLALGRESEAARSSCFVPFLVGKCYDEGLGVDEDDAEALRLYRFAAAQGGAFAQYNLGIMFEKGAKVLVELLCGTRKRPFDGSASPPRRGMQMPWPT